MIEVDNLLLHTYFYVCFVKIFCTSNDFVFGYLSSEISIKNSLFCYLTQPTRFSTGILKITMPLILILELQPTITINYTTLHYNYTTTSVFLLTFYI